MGNNNSYISQIHERMNDILVRFEKILSASTIENKPIYSPSQTQKYKLKWSKLPPSLEREQGQLIKDFEEWYIDFYNLFINPTRDEDTQIKNFYFKMSNWFTDRGNPNNYNNPREIIDDFKRMGGEYIALAGQLPHIIESDPIFIPDTNAIIEWPDLAQMLNVIDIGKAIFVITTTTISELDDLKSNKREEAFKKRVKAAISQLEMILSKGDVIEGVVISDKLIIKMLATEPNFANLPGWLDKDNKDDRIIASAMELQRKYHGSVVSIITNDINMRTKAQLGKILTKNIPRMPEL